MEGTKAPCCYSNARNSQACDDCVDSSGDERLAFRLPPDRRMTFEPRKKLRIIVLCHEDLVPPDSLKGLSDKDKLEVKTEYDVISTMEKDGSRGVARWSLHRAERERERTDGSQATHRLQPAGRVSWLPAVRPTR